ncbi:hypothetical protein [Streptomyces sp. NPDC018693]|uniref:hypothetical protein n=1 Tax=unclassified Streptomyces TaxID=2593676 RepID=UPI00379B7E3E
MPAMPLRRVRRPFLIATVTAISCAAVAGGLVMWHLRGSGDGSDSCDILLQDTRVHKALGDGYKAGMNCSELGAAIRNAAVGTVDPSDPEGHSLRQAQAMKNVLVAVEDSLRETGEHLDPELRMPLAESLAAYRADTHVILGLGDADYVRHALPNQPAWENDSGVHMSLSRDSLLRIVRSVSEDPAAYVTLRDATTQRAAQELASVSSDTTGAELIAPPARSSSVLGTFDAVADDVRRDLDNTRAEEWQQDVLSASTKVDSVPPPYAEDPVSHLVGSWRRTLRESGEASSAEVFERQSAAMVDTWSSALGLDDKTRSSLREDAASDSFQARREALRKLS